MRSAGPSSLKLPPLSELNARCVECSPDRYKRPLVRDMVFALGWKPYGDQFELVLPAVSFVQRNSKRAVLMFTLPSLCPLTPDTQKVVRCIAARHRREHNNIGLRRRFARLQGRP